NITGAAVALAIGVDSHVITERQQRNALEALLHKSQNAYQKLSVASHIHDIDPAESAKIACSIAINPRTPEDARAQAVDLLKDSLESSGAAPKLDNHSLWKLGDLLQHSAQPGPLSESLVPLAASLKSPYLIERLVASAPALTPYALNKLGD